MVGAEVSSRRLRDRDRAAERGTAKAAAPEPEVSVSRASIEGVCWGVGSGGFGRKV